MDDAQLVDRVLLGDREAFGGLVERHQRWITVVALRATGNLEEADDLAQETFLRAWRSLAGWRREAAFGTWLGHILRNLLRDRGRAASPATESLEAAADPAADAEQERRLLDREMLEALRRAYEAIPPGRQREVVRMRFLEGRRLDEIAAALGLQVGTVKAHLFRGTQKLRGMVVGLREG
jgi:RNA polymerase sigma-70 factor (ECF subfamily)